MPSIKIDRIKIRLKNISPQLARSSIAGLGNELLEHLIKERFLLKEKSGGKISRIDLGPFQIGNDLRSSDLRKTITGGIVESIASKTKTGTRKEE